MKIFEHFSFYFDYYRILCIIGSGSDGTMMEFLYFPEDKTEYIPAVISLIIFMIGAFITFYLIKKASLKEEKRITELMESKEKKSLRE
jgi:phosphotransferase system  glucose/maltose/N-acetylglucosamine-specific IIC component